MPRGSGSMNSPCRVHRSKGGRVLILHPPTLHLVGIIVTLVAAGVSLLTWYHHRDGPGLRGWAVALLLSGLGSLLFILRGADTPFSMVAVTNALFVAGFALMWMSMRRFNDRRLGPWRMAVSVVAVTIAFAVLFTLAWQAGAAVRAQTILFSLFIAGLALATARETWRGRQLDGLRSRALPAAALVGIAAARLVRAALVGLQAIGAVDTHVNAAALSYAQYFTTIFILVVTFGLVLMANERFERQYARLTEGRPAAD